MGKPGFPSIVRHLHRTSRAAALVLACLMPASVMAADFTVSPVRIFISPGDRAIAVTITNESDQTLVMQADLYHWEQTATGEDLLELTEELFLSPPIIQLAPFARQVVRLARLTTATPPEQLTYRLIVREIPEARQADDQLEVQIALALSLPIFVTPANARSQMECDLGSVQPGAVEVICSNNGTAYAQPRGLRLESASGQILASLDTALYLLPGVTRHYLLSASTSLPGGPARLVITLDDNSDQTFSVQLD